MFTKIEKFGKFVSKPELGAVVHYVYNAKGKDHLPIWDRFPLCIPADSAEGGFYGWNLHYVNPQLRKVILNELLKNSGKPPIERLRANYGLLKTMSVYDEIKPCIKRYLTSHVQSRFLMIHPENWFTVLMLPTAQWVKKRAVELDPDLDKVVTADKKRSEETKKAIFKKMTSNTSSTTGKR